MTEVNQKILDDSIASLKDFFPHLEDPAFACGICFVVSSRFADFLESNGIKSDILLLLDYTGEPFVNIHPLWTNQDFLNHSVVLVGDKVYDFTRRQFNPLAPIPFIQTLDEVKAEWESVSKALPWEDDIEKYRLQK